MSYELTSLRAYKETGAKRASRHGERKWDDLMASLLKMENNDQTVRIPHNHELACTNAKFQPRIQGVVALLNRRAAKEGHIPTDARPWTYQTWKTKEGKTEYTIVLK